MPGEFYVESGKVPTLESYLRRLRSAGRACPRARSFVAGTDSTVARRTSGTAPYYVVDAQADHHRRVSDGRAARTQSPTDGTIVEFS